MQGYRIALLLAVLLAVLAGCRPPTEPIGGKAPWQDGEQCTLDVLGNDQWKDAKYFRLTKHEDGWAFDYESEADKKRRGTIVMAPDLAPLRAEHHRDEQRWEVTYGEREITVVAHEEGKSETKTAPRDADVVDGDQFFLIPRGLPLAGGYERQLTVFTAKDMLGLTATLRVLGEETIEVPAGRFETWHTELDFGAFGGKRELWYAKQPPHWYVKYHWPGQGSQMLLRSFREKAGAPVQGQAERPPDGPAPAPPSPKWSFVATSLLVQYPLMIFLPLLLAFWLRRKLSVPLGVAGVGALSFVASQVVHLPLNYALGLMGRVGPVTTLPLAWIGIVAGLSAGLCEECARYGFMRWALKKHRGFNSALQFGAGHGGVEAMIFGFLAGVSLLNFLVLPLYSESVFTPELQAVARQYWAHGWEAPIYAGIERIGAICAHIGMSVVVMCAVTRRNLAYLLAAIVLHAALDAPVVLFHTGKLHPLVMELGVIAVGLAFLGIGFLLRHRAEPIEDAQAT